MQKIIFFAAFAALLAICSAAEHENQKVHVTVYYESLCPDSRKFFNKQLYPSLQGNLSNYVNLTLIPFGKSSFVKDPTTQEYKFTCHHGPEECMGNKIHACALKNIEGDAGFNRNAIGFINCLMDRSTKEFPTKECAEINHVTTLLKIDNCAIHPDGATYLANYGTLTNALKPALTSVPTIVFNHNYKKEDSDLAQSNFVKAICQYIDTDKPEECLKNGANFMTFSIFSVLIVALNIVRSI